MNGRNEQDRPDSVADEQLFRDLVAKADECDELSKRYAAAGNKMYAEHYQQCADRFRQDACGFSAVPVMKDFIKTRERVSLGLNQEALDALDEMGVTKKQRARFLARLTEEAIFAYKAAGPRRKEFVRLDPKVGKTRWEERFWPSWLHPSEWLAALGFQDTAAGWRNYVTMLIDLAGNAKAQEEMGFGEMSRGWGIGTHGWRRAMAKEYSHLAISPGIPHAELCDLKEARWTELLTTALRHAGKTAEEIAGEAKGAAWKIEIARELRERHATPAAWIADRLNMGRASSVRVYLSERSGEE